MRVIYVLWCEWFMLDTNESPAEPEASIWGRVFFNSLIESVDLNHGKDEWVRVMVVIGHWPSWNITAIMSTRNLVAE